MRHMARLFDKNIFIMMVSVMIGIIIITYFVADIVNRSKIDDLNVEHGIEIGDINSRNENFTDHFLQASLTMDSGREVREVGNYYFDFALFWYNTALSNSTNTSINKCIENCENAMSEYRVSQQKFESSKPFFEDAKQFTDRYEDILNHYISFAQSGVNITTLRYNASNYLRQIAENLTLNNMVNISMLLELYNETTGLYNDALKDYEDWKDDIDGYVFFSEDREAEYPE